MEKENSRHVFTEADEKLILEMYKSHYSAKEVCNRHSFGYGTVISLYRAFKVAEIEKYSRKPLLKAL